MSQRQPILEAQGLVKRYGQVVALDGADFDLFPDEILAIIGDNGAGKSTLIKALSGALQPDEGEIRLDGKQVHFRSPRDSRSHRRSTSRPTSFSAERLVGAGRWGLRFESWTSARCGARRLSTSATSRSASSR